MVQALIRAIEESQLKDSLPKVATGDTVDVHVRIIEGSKERIQIFNGVIIKRQGAGMNETITVRRIVANEGVERVFPLHSPRIAALEVKHRGHTRRAKLYYLRNRVGKKRRLRDRRRGLRHLVEKTETPPKEAEKEEVVAPTEGAAAEGETQASEAGEEKKDGS